jgi:threonine aldolase
MAAVQKLFEDCQNRFPGHGPVMSVVATLREIADSLDGSEMPDIYGAGDYIEAFEAEVAALFGKSAAVFMPSGTMAQQIALRIWCDQSHNLTVAMHPTSHLEFAEHLGYQFLHNIRRLQFGGPEFLRDRLLTTEDFRQLGSRPGAVILELPARPLGGQLPPWEDLVATCDWARKQGIPIHLDGARIWQCQHFYQKSLAEIGALFDSIYVSFYKDLGGLAGCMLLGSKTFVQESRVWQRRYGGNLFNQAANVASARLGLQQRLPQMSAWVLRAQEIAERLSSFEQVIINPACPQVNFFQLFIKGDPVVLAKRHHELAATTGTYLFHRLAPAAIPGFATTEMHIWENAAGCDLDCLVPFMSQLLDAEPRS